MRVSRYIGLTKKHQNGTKDCSILEPVPINGGPS